MRITAAILMLLLCTSVQAKNLGVWGTVYPIGEEDFSAFIYARLHAMQKNGELEKAKQQFISNVKKHTLRPTPVAGLTVTQHPRTFYYDPTYRLNRTITDAYGRVLFPKGTAVNPLNKVHLSEVLFFLNADDKRQIFWAKDHAKDYDFVKYILVGGNVQTATNTLQNRVYFDQYGRITKKLGIHHIPCIVKQDGKRMRIREYSLRKYDAKVS